METPDDRYGMYEPRSWSNPDDDSSYGRTVTASLEEIRYAQQLRLQIRESYARQPAHLPPQLWCVGAD